jgi:hypothetical protein
MQWPDMQQHLKRVCRYAYAPSALAFTMKGRQALGEIFMQNFV